MNYLIQLGPVRIHLPYTQEPPIMGHCVVQHVAHPERPLFHLIHLPSTTYFDYDALVQHAHGLMLCFLAQPDMITYHLNEHLALLRRLSQHGIAVSRLPIVWLGTCIGNADTLPIERVEAISQSLLEGTQAPLYGAQPLRSLPNFGAGICESFITLAHQVVTHNQTMINTRIAHP